MELEDLNPKVLTLITNLYKDRPYHNLKHIEFMLNTFKDLYKSIELYIPDYTEFTLAIIFHDIIQGENDIEYSCWLANRILPYQNCNYDLGIINKLIEATTHDKRELVSFEEKLIHDLDLFILAQDHNKYYDYIKAIKEEYKDIDNKSFIQKRKEFIKDILQDKIYLTEYFEKYEEKARNNLKWELKNLDNLNNIYYFDTYIIGRPLLLNQVTMPANIEKQISFYNLDQLFQAKQKIEEVTDKETFLCCKELLNTVGVSLIRLIPIKNYEYEYNNLLQDFSSEDSIIKWR